MQSTKNFRIEFNSYRWIRWRFLTPELILLLQLDFCSFDCLEKKWYSFYFNQIKQPRNKMVSTICPKKAYQHLHWMLCVSVQYVLNICVPSLYTSYLMFAVYMENHFVFVVKTSLSAWASALVRVLSCICVFPKLHNTYIDLIIRRMELNRYIEVYVTNRESVMKSHSGKLNQKWWATAKAEVVTSTTTTNNNI